MLLSWSMSCMVGGDVSSGLIGPRPFEYDEEDPEVGYGEYPHPPLVSDCLYAAVRNNECQSRFLEIKTKNTHNNIMNSKMVTEMCQERPLFF